MDYNTAQPIVALGYSDSYKVRNLHFQVKCNGKEDFLECVDIIGSYNSFDKETIQHILEDIGKREDLLNIGYIIGREGSPVIYLEIWNEETRKAILEMLGDGDKYKIDEVGEEGWYIRLWFD